MQEQGNVLEAFQCYSTAIRIRPDFAIAHGNLGSCLLVSGEVQRAICALRRAVQLEPNFPDAYNNLGNALRDFNKPFAMLQLSGEFRMIKGDTTELMSRELSQKHQRKADAGEAIECYRTVLRLQPNHPHAYSNLGNAMRDRGLVREAIHCNVTAARLMPSFAPAHTNLGSLLREQGQLEQAIAHYHQAIALDPDFAEAYLNLGNTYRDIRQPSAEQFRAINLTSSFCDHIRLDDAIKCFTTALDISTHLAEGHAALAAVTSHSLLHETYLTCVDHARHMEIKGTTKMQSAVMSKH
jgi:protein O-GlcNAc transferase